MNRKPSGSYMLLRKAFTGFLSLIEAEVLTSRSLDSSWKKNIRKMVTTHPTSKNSSIVENRSRPALCTPTGDRSGRWIGRTAQDDPHHSLLCGIYSAFTPGLFYLLFESLYCDWR